MKTIGKELISNFNSEQHRLVVNILYTAEWLNSRISGLFNEKDITLVQYNMLRILAGSSPNCLSVGDIKSRLIRKKTDVTRVLDRLVSKDLVTREICKENRRQVNVTITSKGICLMEELSPLLKVIYKNYFQEIISDEDAKQSNYVLDLMRSEGEK